MRHLRFNTALVVLFLSLFLVDEVHAENGQTYEVGTSILHVRGEPDHDAPIIGLLQRGDKVTAFQEKFGWVQTYYAGEVAWIAKHYLVPIASEQPPTMDEAPADTMKITVTAPSVNIRSGPGLDYAVVGGTWQGETFETIGQSGDWLKVSLVNGSSGWIASWLTNASAENQTASTNEPVAEVSNEQTAEGSLSGLTIVLDAGHGGRDPGAIAVDGTYEKDLIVDITRNIAAKLRTYGATVIETRTADYFISLDERANMSNREQADAFISVHYNSFPVLSVQGINTFYNSQTDYQLALDIHSELAANVPLQNRGIEQANYKVLRNTQAPSILLELGFISNPYDLSMIRTADYQNNVADSIAAGLMQYFLN